MHECKIFHIRLQECNQAFPTEDKEGSFFNSSSLADALDLLTTSDEQIGLLIAEVPPLQSFPIITNFSISHYSELVSKVISSLYLKQIEKWDGTFFNKNNITEMNLYVL